MICPSRPTTFDPRIWTSVQTKPPAACEVSDLVALWPSDLFDKISPGVPARSCRALRECHWHRANRDHSRFHPVGTGVLPLVSPLTHCLGAITTFSLSALSQAPHQLKVLLAMIWCRQQLMRNISS